MCKCREFIVAEFEKQLPVAEELQRRASERAMKHGEALVGLVGLLDPTGREKARMGGRLNELKKAQAEILAPMSAAFRERLVRAHVIQVVCGGIAEKIDDLADPEQAKNPEGSGVSWLVEHLEMALEEARALAMQDERIRAGEKL